MKRTLAVAFLACLAGCGNQPEANLSQSSERASLPTQQEDRPTAEPANASTPGASHAQTVSDSAGAAKDAQGAADVVQHYYALIGSGEYEKAWTLRWGSEGPGVDRFVASFAPYAEYHATVGTPTEIQGAAGSLYVDVPVQLYGRKKDGKPFGSAGTITLRRANDVPGSTAAERRWRIYTND